MKTLAPGYYKKCKCISDKSTHNCCIGWEIDIDETTQKKCGSLRAKWVRK